MKQILQNIKDGQTEVADVPVPGVSPGTVLIETSRTLISAGTERMLVDFGRAGWLDKARQQPDKVRMALAKILTDGLVPTIEAISSKLSEPLPLGYCNVGRIAETGSGVAGFSVGDRVVSNGHHAEYVRVPTNLIARIPDEVSEEQAVFAVLGAIGLQGVRLANPTIGECVVVTGLGLIGLMTVQILRSHGCRVLGIDFDDERLKIAQGFGAEVVNPSSGINPVKVAEEFSRGRGVDAVLITASTKSNEPVSQAAAMCRKRGRIVLVGVTGLELSRADFYEKELSFQVSCSYGPGRYDANYEEGGQDYPVGFVRWTEQRNFEAVLDLMAAGGIDVAPLISHSYSIDAAGEAYEKLVSDSSALGIVLEFDESGSARPDGRSIPTGIEPASISDGVTVGVIGAGNYSGRVLMPALQAAGGKIKTVVSSGGVSAATHGRRVSAQTVATDVSKILSDDQIDLTVVATRHDSHAKLVIDSLSAGKSVFVEKPLCLDIGDLDTIAEAAEESGRMLMVGFNRRFSPLTVSMMELLEKSDSPMSIVMTVNAGAIPSEHWTRDAEKGGGRIVGEACHFIDLLRFIAGRPIVDYNMISIPAAGVPDTAAESAIIGLEFEDGSIGTVQYLTGGHRSFPKERLEVFVDGKVLRLDNFRRLEGWGWKGFRNKKLWSQDKGQRNCMKATIAAVKNGTVAPIAIEEILEVARISIELGILAK